MSEYKNIRNKIGDVYRSIYSYIKPVSNTSSFFEKGILTPQEFIDAGDYLVDKFKTWEWQKVDETKCVSYLPSEKQFLLMRNAPCRQRVRDLNYMMLNSKTVEDDWIFPDYKEDDNEIDLTLRSNKDFFLSNRSSIDEKISEKGDDTYESIDLYNSDIDESTFKENDPASVCCDNTFFQQEKDEHDNTMPIRTYDISVTYDKYYQTPRIWLFGYNEDGIPLKSEECFEDILADYTNQTVTHDIHPYTGIVSATIHPCKQAEVLLKVVKRWIADNLEPRHDLSILILLKNISTIIPTIEYDFTIDIEMSMYFKN